MTEGQKILIVAVVSAIASPLIVSLVKFCAGRVWGRFHDTVRLKAKIGGAGDLAILETIGCPGLILQLKCVSIRPAKIADARICLEGDGFVEALQEGFNSKLPRPVQVGDRPPETLYIVLRELSCRNVTEGFVLGQDDVCKFCLPLMAPCLTQFCEAPSQNVSVRVTFFDGEDRKVLIGLQLQTVIRGLLTMYPNEGEYKLKDPVKIGVRTAHEQLTPIGHMVGRTNTRPVVFGHGPPDEIATPEGQPLVVECPGCGLQVGVPQAKVGQELRCPRCQTVATISDMPAGESQEAPDGGPVT